MYTKGDYREEPVFVLVKHQRQELVEENETVVAPLYVDLKQRKPGAPRAVGILGQCDHWAREVSWDRLRLTPNTLVSPHLPPPPFLGKLLFHLHLCLGCRLSPALQLRYHIPRQFPGFPRGTGQGRTQVESIPCLSPYQNYSHPEV